MFKAINIFTQNILRSSKLGACYLLKTVYKKSPFKLVHYHPSCFLSTVKYYYEKTCCIIFIVTMLQMFKYILCFERVVQSAEISISWKRSMEIMWYLRLVESVLGRTVWMKCTRIFLWLRYSGRCSSSTGSTPRGGFPLFHTIAWNGISILDANECIHSMRMLHCLAIPKLKGC